MDMNISLQGRAKGVPRILLAKGQVLIEGLELSRFTKAACTLGACQTPLWGFHFISQAFKMPKGKAFRRTLRITSLFFSSKGFARIFVAQDLRNLLQGSEVRGQLNPLLLLQLLFGHHLLVLVSPQLPGAVFEGEAFSVVLLRPCR